MNTLAFLHTPWQGPGTLCLLVSLTGGKDKRATWHPVVYALSLAFTRGAGFAVFNKGIERQEFFQNF